ncbi:MAG TPA: acyl-ACP desaturase [Mycobacteriales bacterium]|jgi:acyl-[acyl-carrier-protein] desaturase|nr:acyl-ACP desaturase [Mycobacteriales bacterium]
METTALLRELEPVVAGEVNRHLAVAKEWMPHEYVPWSLGRDYDGTPWSPEESTLSSIARTALEVNLLTEDNLPSYHREIDAAFGREGAWGTWTGRWTAEEGRHGLAIRDYLLTTRGVDPVQLERDRMAQMQHGYHSNDKNIFQVMAYVSFQELATRIAHRNTGRYSNDPVCDRLLARVATDENLHMIFYRNLVAATLEVDRSAMVQAIRDEVVGFQMPGTGIRDFQRKAVRIAQAGIYDLRIHHDEVLWPLLRHWGFFELDGLDGDAEKARTEVAEFVAALDTMATSFTAAREEREAKLAARG